MFWFLKNEISLGFIFLVFCPLMKISPSEGFEIYKIHHFPPGEILGKKYLVIDELDSEILSTFIYKMISVSPNEIVYYIAGTKNYSDNEFKERRFEFLKTKPIIVETYHAPDGLAKMLYRVVVI